MKQLAWVAALAALLFMSVNLVNSDTTYGTFGDVNVKFSPSTGMMSINASNGSLLDLQKQLLKRYKIQLFIVGLERDEPFSASVRDKFIDDALRQAIPSKYKFSYKMLANKEVKNAVIEGKERLQTQAKRPSERPATVKQKSQNEIRPQEVTIEKSKPMDKLVAADKKGSSAKLAAPTGRSIEKTTLSKYQEPAKGDRADARENDDDNSYHMRMLVKVSDDGSVEALKAVRVKGKAVQAEVRSGDIVYNVKDGSKTLYSGSFSAPVLHSLPPDGGPHRHLQGKVAYVNIPLPEAVLNKNVQGRANVEFLKVKGEAPVDFKKLNASRKFEKIGDVKGAQLTRIATQ